MKRAIVVLTAFVLSVGGVGVAWAQTPTPRPARKPTDTKPAAVKKDEMVSTKMAVGTAKAVAADSLVVAGKTRGKETEWTFAVVPTTKVRKAGQKITSRELNPGDLVRVRYVEHQGTSVAQDIAVTSPARTKTPTRPVEKR